jgi:hypothetical protein
MSSGFTISHIGVITGPDVAQYLGAILIPVGTKRTVDWQ